MAKVSIQAGSVSQSLNIFIQNSTSTSGAGLTGLTGTSTGLTACYVRQRTTATPIALTTGAPTASYGTGILSEIDSTRAPGLYRFDPPDTALGTGSPYVTVMLQGAGSMAPLALEVELTAWNNQDGVAGGMIGLSSTGTLGSVSNVRGTATVILASGTHTGVVIPVVQTASVVVAGVTATSVSDKSGYSLTAAYDPAKTAAQAAILGTSTSASIAVGLDAIRAKTDNLPASPADETLLIAAANAILTQVGTSTSGSIAVSVDAIRPKTGALPASPAATTDVTSARDSVLTQIGTSTSGSIAVGVDAIRAKTGTLPAQPAATGDAMTLTAGERTTLATVISTSSLAESYRANGVGGSIAQMLYEINAHVGEFIIVGTSTAVGGATKSLRKIDHTTTAAVFTIDSTASPASITRAS